MGFYFFKSLKLFVETASFVFARIIPNLYFAILSMLIWLFFILVPFYFDFNFGFEYFNEGFLVLGFIVFLFYWNFFRKRITYILKSSGAVVVSEFISGRTVPVTMQTSFGFNLIKRKFNSMNDFREFESNSKKVLKKLYGVLGFVGFIPNINSAVSSSILSFVFADPAVDHYTSLRDSLILFYQKKNSILFQIFAIHIFSYILFFLSYLVLFLFLMPVLVLTYPFNLVLYVLIFLFLLIIYSSFISHFLICWQSVFFTETVKDDVASKITRVEMENLSSEFNEISSKAKTFVPLKSLSSRKLIAFNKSADKKNSFMASLDSVIKDKASLDKSVRGGDALSDLVSKAGELKKMPVKRQKKEKAEEETRTRLEKYEKEQEYNTIFNLLLEFLGEQLGSKNNFSITSLKKKNNNWLAIVIINEEPFDFKLDLKGNVLEFKEK